MVCILDGLYLERTTGILHLLILGRGLNVVSSTGVADRGQVVRRYFCLRVAWLWRFGLFSLSTMQFSNINSLLFIFWLRFQITSIQNQVKREISLIEELSRTIKPTTHNKQINVILKLKMEGQQLPKATMNSYIKTRTNFPFSADYLLKMLYIAKEFVARVADKSNVMCESYQKKTISVQHLEAALSQFGLTYHLEDLKNIEESIKEQNQLKRQASQRMQEMIAKDKQQQRERRKIEEAAKKEVTVRQRFDQIEKQDPNMEQEFDYQNMKEDEVEIIEKAE